MRNNIPVMSILLCVSGLSACTMDDGSSTYSSELPYRYQNQNIQLYSDGYQGSPYRSDWQDKKEVAVPESYHVGNGHAPVPAKDRDREWVTGQNPQSYTIELADDEKASAVANTLYKTPKNEHSAEVKYKNNNTTHYKGLYGSYPSKDAAEQALSTLPQDIKQRATVKTWGTVQQGMDE